MTNFSLKGKRRLFCLSLIAALFCASTIVRAQSTVIVSPTLNDGDFENSTSSWTIANGTQKNKWQISTGATTGFSGTRCAYVSQSTAAPYAHDYDRDVTSVVHFYQDVTLPAGEPNATLSFKIICQGEGTSTLYDYLRVYLVPTTTTPTPGTDLGTTNLVGTTYNLLGSGWVVINVNIPPTLTGNATSASTRRLIFQWSNDNSAGTMPPAGIDSVTLTTFCAGPVLAAATGITPSTATLNWNTVTGATGYEVRYKKVTDPVTVATWATPTAVAGGSTTSLNVSSLDPNQTQYEYQVRAVGACPYWSLSSMTFKTTCLPFSVPYLETFESITANNNLPSCMSATNLGTNVLTYTAPTGSNNQTNHTPGGSKFASFRWGSNDWIFTPELNLTAGQAYLLEFWYISDSYSGWTSLKAAFGTGANATAMTTTVGTPVLNATNTSYKLYRGIFTAPATGQYNVGINMLATTNPSRFTIDDISVTPLPPCSGTPSAGNISMTSPVNECAGKNFTLVDTGYSLAGGISYQWIQSLNGGTTWTPVAGGSGATTDQYTTPTLTDTIMYAMVVTCVNGNLKDTTDPVLFNIASPSYATVPFTEGFESWINRCSTTDVPSQYWTANPATGNFAWRRHDQGGSASWGNVGSYLYNPAFYQGSYSARFHSGYASPAGNAGKMDLYLNCGPLGGALELQFRYINIDGSDSLKVFLSTNNGQTFTQIGGYATANVWTQANIPFTSNSLQTVIRFEGKSDYGSTDIGLDYVRVLPPCSGTPVAGTINAPASVCSGTDFTLTLNGSSASSGLTYQWQSSANGTTWTNVAGATADQLTTSITTPTYFRVLVSCTASGNTVTSNSVKVEISSFLLCYCIPTYSDGGSGDRINRVQLGTLDNNSSAAGNNPPYFVDYSPQQPATLPIPLVHQASTDTVRVTFGSDGTQYVSVWIDFNRNGIFESTERFTTGTSHSGGSTAKVAIAVPANASIGITKMRIRGGDDSQIGAGQACGATNSTYGEAEDYLVDIRYPRCTGPANAGIAESSDASLCIGYNLLLTDTTHTKQQDGLGLIWQTSTDGGVNWSNVAGSQDQDQITPAMTGPVQYRVRMTCQYTQDTTYSNAVAVTVPQPWQCYCVSIATGKQNDTTDFGAFKIGSYVLNTGGPHINNPKAIRGRTDNTNSNIILYADSTYEVNFFQAMRYSHSNAKITMFIDYDNNLQYDIPGDRVLTAYTSPTDWYLVRQITLPGTLIPDVPTGLRIIINNNTGANAPSDDGCGTYTSGETEDYVVTLRKAFPQGVVNTGLLRDLSLYPNPTEGRFTVQFNTVQPIKDLKVVVMNLTGQQVAVQQFSHPGAQFRTEMDLRNQPKGVYLVEVIADGDKAVRKLIVR